jgi:hypothetical protein
MTAESLVQHKLMILHRMPFMKNETVEDHWRQNVTVFRTW